MTGAYRQSFNPALLGVGLASKCVASIGMLGHSVVSIIGSVLIGRLSLLHGSDDSSDMFNGDVTKIALGNATLIQFFFTFFTNLITFLK